MKTQSSNLDDKPVWTFTSDSCGYMLYKNGQPQGGAATMGTRTHCADGRRRHWKHIRADITMHRNTAQTICDRNNKLKQEQQALPA